MAQPSGKVTVDEQVRPAIQAQADVIQEQRLRHGTDVHSIQDYPGVRGVNGQVTLSD
jgi:hypothetical protein